MGGAVLQYHCWRRTFKLVRQNTSVLSGKAPLSSFRTVVALNAARRVDYLRAVLKRASLSALSKVPETEDKQKHGNGRQRPSTPVWQFGNSARYTCRRCGPARSVGESSILIM